MEKTAVQTRYNLTDVGAKSLTASRVRFLLSLFRFFTGNPDSHEAVGLQEQAEQLDIEALQVLRALCRDSEFHRHDRSVLRSLVDFVRGSNSSNRYFNNSPTRNYNIANNNRSCMFALLVSSFLTGSTATSPTTTMQQADPFAGIRLRLLQLLSHLAVVLFTFAVWWCARREKEEEKVEKKYPKGKITKKRKYRRNRSLGTTSSQEATQEEEEHEEQEEEEEKESKPEEEESKK